ncbi:response regulator transcription factor [Desulfomonile tiedjei]|uniref:Response regulator with CheY-like receiver domain and winged-helix DNA-binding domain n=1 Tax=Desulfomonile tiedjei (strain ATCC 49306 / DSM 6799 / DCB-1) TaxID=706587 RepID=I4C0J5_DESTA|nr:response regulator transcription factor [Desulfomonile tiedjei]AFM23086.1 response regulator with CheY-like receiver domain and winged-helix DNA-binding domain [Desulfomonile tiedjei DSM 6799]
MSTILLVDDDPDILRILKDNLEFDNYRVLLATNGKEALDLFDTSRVNLVILDLSLPDIDGIQVCRRMRDMSSIPIIMLTARDRVPDKVLGLDSGADDYVSKPFDYLELAARIKACLRRSGLIEDPLVIEIADLKIDTGQNAVWKNGARVPLTQREYALLVLLVKNSGRALSRSVIKESIWADRELYRDSRTIDVHVQHLRAKIEDDPTDPKHIVTIPGTGYIFYE